LLEAKCYDKCNEILDFFKYEFGTTSKVHRLEALIANAKGNEVLAEGKLMGILKEMPQDCNAMKALIAIKRQDLSKLNETVGLLNEYLSVYQSDTEAWKWLAEIYMTSRCYKKAKYCLEEVLV